MADTNTFDSAATDLFCNEETKVLCFDDDGDGDGDDLVQTFNHPSSHTNGEKEVILSNSGIDSEAFIHLHLLSDECIGFMVERERDYLPRHDYVQRFKGGELDFGLRREALDWMFKACARFSFGELCLYLAMTYFDRFLSIYELPLSSLEKGGTNWAVQLVSVACLSLAAKIEEVNVPSTLDLQAGVAELLFEAKTIQRMEFLVLNSLDWKIKAYTPCNFIDYYLRKMNDNKIPSEHTINRSLQIILRTIQGIEFLEFRPSEIAAAVATYVSGKIQAMDIDKALSLLIGVKKGRVVKCLQLVQEMSSIKTTTTIIVAAATTTNGASSVISSLLPHSPNGIIEAACLSYKRDQRSVESCPSSSHSSPDTKRRKLD